MNEHEDLTKLEHALKLAFYATSAALVIFTFLHILGITK
jgi:hypothetical protein